MIEYKEKNMNLTPEEFFEKYQDNIRITAEKIAKNMTPEEQFEKIKNAYFTQEGTKDKEIFDIDSMKNVSISSLLEEIRHLENENFCVFAYHKDKFEEILRYEGNQFSVQNIDIICLFKKILDYRANKVVSKLKLFFVHNHPFIYYAEPSPNDCEFFRNICEMIKDLNKNAICLSIDQPEFGIVTDYDYWSQKQEINKLHKINNLYTSDKNPDKILIN